MSKYAHVKLVAKVPCRNGACTDGTIIRAGNGFGAESQRVACPQCHGIGETETELLHPGEPFFLVRGQDELAPLVVDLYRVLLDRNGGDASGLDDLAERMREFQTANPGLVKTAD